MTDEQKKKYEGKFYVASEHAFERRLHGTWAKDSFDEALEHARKILAKDQEKDYVVIVGVVAFIEREQLPVIVTKFSKEEEK